MTKCIIIRPDQQTSIPGSILNNRGLSSKQMHSLEHIYKYNTSLGFHYENLHTCDDKQVSLFCSQNWHGNLQPRVTTKVVTGFGEKKVP